MAKRVPKASKRRLVFLTPIILLILVYFLFTVLYYGVNLISLKRQEAKLNADLTSLQAEEKELKNEIQKLKDPDYLARYARENFLYSKDGEYIIKVNDSNKPQKENETLFDILEPYYMYITFGVLILIFIFILLIFKRNRKKNKNWLWFINVNK